MTPDDDMLAAELALGLLEADERAEALRRALAEPSFGAAVATWRERFAALAVDVPAVPAPPFADPPVRSAPSATGWRWATGIATLAAAALAGVLLLRPAPPPTVVVERVDTPRLASFAAAMAPSEHDAKPFIAVYDPAKGEVRVAPTITIPDGRSAELWRIGKDGVPHSMGLLVAVGATRLPVPAGVRPAVTDGVTLAVSIEPIGGSPSGKPTGPVVAAGALTEI